MQDPTPEAPPSLDYSNMPLHPTGPLIRIGSKLSKGIRTVQDQIVPYAEDWQRHNEKAITATGPLWVVLGDSMSQGIGATAYDRGYVGQLHELLAAAGREYRIINLSISGARIRDVTHYQLPALKSIGITPDLITVLIGSNDLTSKKRRVNAVESFKELLEVLPRGAVVANLLGVQAEPREIDKRLQHADELQHIVLADIRRHGPRTWRGMTAEDHFHPNNKGYKALAEVFARALGI